MENSCPICGKPLGPADDLGVKTGDFEYFNCAISCGKYKISRSLLKSLPSLLQENKDRVPLLSHFIQAGREIPYLDSYLVEQVFQMQLPNLSDQSKNLILWIGNNTEPGEKVENSFEVFQSIMGAKSIEGTRFIID